MILSLDVSTSCIGYTVLDYQKNIVKYGHWKLLSKVKFKNLFDKTKFVQNKLNEIKKEFDIKIVCIEDYLRVVSKKSSANTITIAAYFNGIISWICYEIFNTIPFKILATSARKTIGIVVRKGEKGKEKAKKYVLDNVAEFVPQWTSQGNLSPPCYDEIDSIVLSYATYELHKQTFNP